MEGQNKNKWFLYHMYGGLCVLDMAQSSDHLRQAYQGDPKFASDIVAGGLKPLTADEIERLEKQYSIKFDVASRSPLKTFQPPTNNRPLRG